ncbi:ABC transporter ATP-binding protein [Phytohabitans flavus]|uniref:ABC transporter ATP-binding protein n=1 Tax=Phytohabitans flavus TaxID=1076124 RepID=A0A6F8XLD3_9ACTN|nr:ABC transporter ATP-binding protein [Phytohabitans flavus]BCB74634.1 ABC transporter ATP-binding protein [Phytohabitans flavus]
MSLPEQPAPDQAWHISASSLTVRYGRRIAVDGLDLTFGAGVHGLLGPNGAGKTTLMRVLATASPATGGSLRILGRPSGDRHHLRAVRRRLGYLPQRFGYYARFTVREFVEYVAWLKEMPAADIPGAAQRVIERVQLGDRAGHRMRTLSGGMVQRVGVAQALVNDPEVLLLDEPTVGLDPEQRVHLRALLRDVGAQTCVIVSTHLVEDIAAACSDVAIIDEGRVAFRGSVDQLAAAGSREDSGDSAVERGYTALLRQHRTRVVAAR